MHHPVVIRSYPQGPRVWLLGQRVHHGASGTILGGVCLALRRPRLAACLLAWAATDLHDARVWFRREGVPAGDMVSALTSDLDELSGLDYVSRITSTSPGGSAS